MPTKGKPKYYWDANVFIAWIKNESRSESGEMKGLEEIVYEIDSGKAILVTSVLTTTEVFSGNLTTEQKQRFDSVFKRPSTVRINVDTNISQKASEIREYYKESGQNIKTPDAIHLATALLLQVDAFHTFEDKLLELDGNVMGHNLTICKPAGRQGTLGFGLGQPK